MHSPDSYIDQFSKECSKEDFLFRLSPINPKTGDFQGNLKLILEKIEVAYLENIKLIIFPEMALSGYNVGDYLFHKKYLEESEKSLKFLTENIPSDMTVILGVIKKNERLESKNLVNTACVIEENKVTFIQEKTFLANNDVFFEPRYFDTSEKVSIFTYKNYRLGIIICEDLWNPLRKSITPVETLCLQGADIIISINASPFYENKTEERINLAKEVVKKNKIPLAYVNLLGGNDDLVFDGHTFFINEKEEIKSTEYFSLDNLDILFPSFKDTMETNTHKISRWDSLYKALTLGLKDYVYKSGFKKVHLGLSGGIDSALVAKIARDALGEENIVGFLLPSIYSSEGSLIDANALASRLGIKTYTVPIEEPLNSLKKVLSSSFSPDGLVEENLQARLRGTILMAYSNREKSMLLTTGNKSEVAVGYCTLYGDMNGAFNPIGDIYKTDIFALCSYLNKMDNCFPENILIKPPSAELRPDQKDEDTLPPYPILDSIIKKIIEERMSLQEILSEEGYEEDTVIKVFKLINNSEFKRFQAAPILKVTPLAFGSGRRVPLAFHNFSLDD